MFNKITDHGMMSWWCNLFCPFSHSWYSEKLQWKWTLKLSMLCSKTNRQQFSMDCTLCSETTHQHLVVPLEFWTCSYHFYGQKKYRPLKISCWFVKCIIDRHFSSLVPYHMNGLVCFLFIVLFSSLFHTACTMFILLFLLSFFV